MDLRDRGSRSAVGAVNFGEADAHASTSAMADPGIILAILSAVFNGSFVAFAKLRSVAACELHPVLFNFYVTLGVFASCFVAAPFFPLVGARFELDALGALAGALFVFAASFSFIAASLVGLSTGQGVWCAAAILVSLTVRSPQPNPPNCC